MTQDQLPPDELPYRSCSRLVFCDIETAGLRPDRHPIVQIAAIAVDERLTELEVFQAKVRFDPHKANRRSLRKNSYHPGLWATEAEDATTVARRFAEFLRRHATVQMTSSKGEVFHVAQIAAHNAAFDGPFLQAWYNRLGIFLPANRLMLCTLQRALWYFAEHPSVGPPRNYQLSTLCHYFGVPFHAADAHEALGDVRATVGLYRALRSRLNELQQIDDSLADVA